MSIHLPPDALRIATTTTKSTDASEDRVPSSESEEGEGEGEEETWSDWTNDDRPLCPSLFDSSTHASALLALAHDRDVHGVDVDGLCAALSLDFHARTRLVNWIRREHPTPDAVRALTGTEPLFASDDLLVPVLEDDPLLQYAGAWSDDEDEDEGEEDAVAASARISAVGRGDADAGAPSSSTSADASASTSADASGPTTSTATASTSANANADTAALRRCVRVLEDQLARAAAELDAARRLVRARLDIDDEGDGERPVPGSSGAEKRDDDTHYFESYGANEIHAVMLQDKVRTSTYAAFVLSNPALFRDAVVLDVGCGTGILSLFAARAGAKKVFAVDASGIARRAREIVHANGFEDVITVIQGKIEDVVLPEDTKVDVIISEWMGYALLYESMLDSVLVARDRFLKPPPPDGNGRGGVLAPSQARIVLALCAAEEAHRERVAFWDDVYGFDMAPMAAETFHEAAVTVVPSSSVLSAPYVLRDFFLASTTVRELDFAAPFALVSSADRKRRVHAFVLSFDVFFDPAGARVPLDARPMLVNPDAGEVAEVWQLGRRPSQPARRKSEAAAAAGLACSFSTGPQSAPTHWKQTLFLLREPIAVDEGTVVEGTFHLRKSPDNSRELDVEIHYVVRPSEGAPIVGDAVVQMYKIR